MSEIRKYLGSEVTFSELKDNINLVKDTLCFSENEITKTLSCLSSHERGRIYHALGEHNKAEEQFMLSIRDGNKDSHNSYGILCTELGYYHRAKKQFELAIDAGIIDAIKNLGYLYIKFREYQWAEFQFFEYIANGGDANKVYLAQNIASSGSVRRYG